MDVPPACQHRQVWLIKNNKYKQMKQLIILLLRIALGVAFLSAVADRSGVWGPPGSPLTAWGNWKNFIEYSGILTFGSPGVIAEILGFMATILEFVLGILLIVGYKVKYTAFLSGLLLLLFGIGMAFNTHIKYALDYSVFSACFGAFLLAYQPVDKWSLDYLKFVKR